METFYWVTIKEHGDNSRTMNDYLDNYLPSNFEVLEQDGTYAEIKDNNNDKIYGVHASGNGDFFNHKVEFELINK